MIPLALRYWREALFVAFVIPLAFMVWMRGERIDTLEARLDAERARYEQQVSDYRAAYEKARADALTAARDVETQQERITHEVSADYQARLADVRARYQRLLAEAKADSRDGREADLPGVSQPAGRLDEGPAYCGLSLEARLVASEQALQLIALQDWLRGQVGIVRE